MSEMEFPVLDVGTFVVEVTIKDQKGASVTLETNEVTVTQEDVESQDVLLRCNELLDEAKARNDLTTVLLNLAAVSRALERVKDETDPNGFLSTGVSETAERGGLPADDFFWDRFACLHAMIGDAADEVADALS